MKELAVTVKDMVPSRDFSVPVGAMGSVVIIVLTVVSLLLRTGVEALWVVLRAVMMLS